MSSSCGQPIILSVITMDLAPAASMNASTSSATPASLRISAPSENQRRRSGGFGILCRHDADGELSGSGIVWSVEGDGSYRVAAKSSLGSFAQPLACTLNHLFVVVRRRPPCSFGTSGADFFPVQNGPETVGVDGGDAVSAIGLRFGGIVTFCCSLSLLAAVQGSSLIVSLPRFVRRVDSITVYPATGRERWAVPGDKNPPAPSARAALDGCTVGALFVPKAEICLRAPALGADQPLVEIGDPRIRTAPALRHRPPRLSVTFP